MTAGAWGRRIVRWFRYQFRRAEAEQEMHAEMMLHLELEAEDLVRRGVPPALARRQAAAAFGGVERFKEDGREARGAGLADGVAQDLRFGLRQLRRRPTVAAAIVLTLGLGIGATTAVYSLVDAVLLHPLPVQHPEELVAVYEAMNPRARFEGTSYPTYLDYRQQSTTLEALAAYATLDVGLRWGEQVDRISVAAVSGNYFGLLGIPVLLGRPLLPEDESLAAASPVVVLSHPLWIRFFQGDPTVIGTAVFLNGSPFTVVGVAPAGFRGTDLAAAPELWFPLTEVRKAGGGGLYSMDVLGTRFFRWLKMIGRRSPSGTPAAIAAELNPLAARLAAEEAAGSNFRRDPIADPITVLPLVAAVGLTARTDLVRFLALLGGVVVATLLVACVNVANLTMTRARERDHEFGIRTAVGAGGLRLARQLVIETGLYAVLGGLVGLGIAALTRRLLASYVLPGGIALSAMEGRLEPRVVLGAIVLVGVATFGAGIGPAVRASRRERGIELVGRAAARPGSNRVAPPLVALQVGLSLLLLIVGGLFVHSLRAGLTTDLGFQSEGIAAATISLRSAGYTTEPAAGQFLATLLEQLARTPGLSGVAAATHIPLSPAQTRMPIAAEGHDPIRDSLGQPGVNIVSPGYFALFGLSFIAGAPFTDQAVAGAAPVAVVNEATAARYWPGQNPIGQRFQVVRGIGDFVTVVGVVRGTKYYSVTDGDLPQFFLPVAQFIRLSAHDQIHLLARGEPGAEVALAALRGGVRRQDPTLPVQDGRLVEDQINTVLMPQRFGSTLLGVFGLVALVISTVGIYGVVAHSVTVRTRELGIRIAVGATSARILASVLRPTLSAVALGAAAGLLAAAMLVTLVEPFLYGVVPHDPAAFVGASSLLLVVATLAATIPARRATRIDPRTVIQD